MGFSKVIFSLSFVILSVYTIAVVEGQENVDEWKCLGETVMLPEKLKKLDQECTEEMKKSGNKEVRCREACKFRKFGVLVNNDPTFDTDLFDEITDSMMPEGAREGLKADVKKCFEAENAKLSDDDGCKSHETYQACFMTAYEKNCGGEDDKKTK